MTHNEHEANAHKAHPSFELEVVLTCTSRNSVEKPKTISTDKALQTVLDVKRLVEKHLSIPVCVQDLTYDSQTVTDEMSLKSIGLRSGDTVHISYPCEADCDAIGIVIAWLYETTACLRNEKPTVRTYRNASALLTKLLTMGVTQRLLEGLSQTYFGSFGEARTTVNRLYFLQMDGVRRLVELLTLIQRVPWSDQWRWMKYLEHQCLQVLWSLCETRHFGEAIYKHGGLECCIKALLHKSVARDDCLADADSANSESDDVCLEAVMISGLVTLRNLSEVTELCRVQLASNLPVLLQALNISTAKLSSNRQSLFQEMTAGHSVATMLSCISFTTETHKFLADSMLINGILHVCQMERPSSTTNGSDRRVMAQLQASLFFTQLALISFEKIAFFHRQRVFDFIRGFVERYTWNDIMDANQRLCTTYETFLPYIRLFYAPDPVVMSGLEGDVSSLRSVCLSVVIILLQATLGRLENYSIMEKEGLVDYFTCIPFHVPKSLEAKARMMITTCRKGFFQPPSLVNMSKAMLARMHFGLELALHASAREIADQL